MAVGGFWFESGPSNTLLYSQRTVKPCLVDVSKLEADINVDRPNISPSWVRRYHVLKQRFAAFHRTVAEFQLGKLADHFDLWTRESKNLCCNTVIALH